MKLWNKFLVLRRDNTIPEWPWLVMGAADPIVPETLRFYANAAEKYGFDSAYCKDIRQLANRMEQWRADNWQGDPDAGQHRIDNPQVVERIPPYSTELPK